MINRQSPAFPSLTVQCILTVFEIYLKVISHPVWEWKERGSLTDMWLFSLMDPEAYFSNPHPNNSDFPLYHVIAHKYQNEFFDIETYS